MSHMNPIQPDQITGTLATPGTNGHRQGRRQEWSQTAGFTRGATTYYQRPMIKKPTWRWFIPLYFYLGGMAGGAAVIGAAAEILGGPRHRATVRHARYLSFLLAPICALLLIADLGRPTRFHHMFRVFKASSPLSVGTWILSAFGALSGALAVKQAAEDDLVIRRNSALGRAARAVPSGPVTGLHGLFGLALGGYTGTLIAATAVPLWAAAGALKGPLFLSSGLATGGAALRLMARLTGTASSAAEDDIEDVEHVATMAALGLIAARDLVTPPQVREPLRRGLWGTVFKFGAVGGGLVTPLALGWVGRFGSRRTQAAVGLASAALTLAGGIAERFAITEAGKKSAMDPLAYQAMTKGAPGEARPTAEQQARRASERAHAQPFQPFQVVPEG